MLAIKSKWCKQYLPDKRDLPAKKASNLIKFRFDLGIAKKLPRKQASSWEKTFLLVK